MIGTPPRRTILHTDLSALDGNESLKAAMGILADEGWYRVRAYVRKNCCILATRIVCEFCEHAGIEANGMTVGTRVWDSRQIRDCSVREPVMREDEEGYFGHVVAHLPDAGVIVDISFPQFQLDAYEEFRPLIFPVPPDWTTGQRTATYTDPAGWEAEFLAHPAIKDHETAEAWTDPSRLVILSSLTRRYDRTIAENGDSNG